MSLTELARDVAKEDSIINMINSITNRINNIINREKKPNLIELLNYNSSLNYMM